MGSAEAGPIRTTNSKLIRNRTEEPASATKKGIHHVLLK